MPLKIDGSGNSLQERNFAISEKLGIDILYSTSFLDFVIENKYVQEIILMQENNKILKLETDSLIMALGGYEFNAYLREKFLGKNWKDIAIRGVPSILGTGFFLPLKIICNFMVIILILGVMRHHKVQISLIFYYQKKM